MKALVVNCTKRPAAEASNTAALAGVLVSALRGNDVEVDEVRVVDHRILAAGSSGAGDDQWSGVRARILDAEILIFATPGWLARSSSSAQRVLGRMDAMLFDADAEQRPVAYNHVAGVVVTGDGGGAPQVISDISSMLGEIGFTIPGQSSTYWNSAPNGEADEDEATTNGGREWADATGRTAASNLFAAALALEVNPIPAPPDWIPDPPDWIPAPPSS
jgi:multimeric flavodoxin WrbA